MTAFYAQQPFSPFGPSSTFSAPDLGLPPAALPAHLRQPQASSSSTPSSSASSFAPALFSPSLFAPSPLSPSAGPAGGSYFTALPDSMAHSFGLLQANSAFFGQQLPVFTPPPLHQHQHQQQARLTAIEDEASFWSTSPPPPASRPTASLFEFESAGRQTAEAVAAAAAANSAGDRADSASSSSFSVHTPTGSEDGAFDDLRAVDESERGDLSLLAEPSSIRMERAGSEHSDGALRSADGKGYVVDHRISPAIPSLDD
jgi:hypothetical protein